MVPSNSTQSSKQQETEWQSLQRKTKIHDKLIAERMNAWELTKLDTMEECRGKLLQFYSHCYQASVHYGHSQTYDIPGYEYDKDDMAVADHLSKDLLSCPGQSSTPESFETRVL